VSANALTPRAALSVVRRAVTQDWRRWPRSAILRGMTGRPCKPGSDLHGLWRLLLPGTAFPACGAPEEADTSEHIALAENARDDKTEADQPQR
jgi:hypothetical protein